MACHRRGPWSNSEDNYLMQLVQTHGALNWVRIAQTLGSRTPKQCRERYHQNLKPTLNHDPITPEEGLQIERLVHEIGKRWAEIARRLHGRSDNAVKNWWNGSQNRRKRLDRRRAVHSGATYEGDPLQASTSAVNTTLPLPSAAFPRSPGPGVGVRHRLGTWQELPLPSPCSSEPSESEAGSNYTTSPAGQPRSLESYRPHVELPPLRTWQGSRSTDSQLPSVNLLDKGANDRGVRDPQVRLPPLLAHTQLPTAPNSPTQHQHQDPRRGQEQTPTTSVKTESDKDSRMKLAALLG